MKFLAAGDSVTDACDKAGIPRRTYYLFLHQHGELIANYRELLIQEEILEIGMIGAEMSTITEKLVIDAGRPETSPADRLSIKRYLDARVQELSGRHQATSSGEARKFLTGPNLREAKSTDLRVKVTDSSVDISIPRTPIIDLSQREEEP